MAKTKRKIKKRSIVILIMFLLCIISSAYSIYSLSLLHGIETTIRMILCGIIAVLACSFSLGYFNSLKKKNKKYLLYIPITLIYSFVLLMFGYYIHKTYKVVDKVSSNKTTYSSSLVALSTNKTKKIKDVKGKVGLLKDKTNVVGNEIPNDAIKENKLKVTKKEYETYIELIEALYDEEVDYAFLPSNYNIMFSNYEGKDFSNIADDTKVIYTKEKAVKEKQTKSSKLDKPFTILLMGVDSDSENLANASFNGDSLMLITFNPETLNATILSIPRDTYVPIMCFAGQAKSKITHAAWNGEKCMMSTIENFTGIDIDYFVKINFKGVVKLVDALGGVEVDVPYSFCESNSNREFGDNTIFVEKGLQTLNGEKALAFSRNRHTWEEYCGPKYSNYTSNDFVRGQNQQTVVKAILNKIKAKSDIQTIYKLLDVLGNNMETNMDTNQILSLYNIVKDVIAKSQGANIDDVIGMQKLYLSGSDAYIYDTSMGMNLYNFVLYKESLNAVIEAMEINLGKKDPTIVKEFSFSINEEYETPVIGKMDSGTTESHPGRKDVEEKTCGTNEELGADKVTCVCKWGYTKQNGACVKQAEKSKEEISTEEKTINECVSENGKYYWYDSDGNKNPTAYMDSVCSVEYKEEDDPTPSGDDD